LSYGWKEGYYAQFTSGDMLFSLGYKMNNIVSRFPNDTINSWFQKRKEFSLNYDKYKGYGIKRKNYELPDLNIGDDSITYRVDYEDISFNEAGQLERDKITNFFVIEFIKSDVYEYIEGLDYELIKQVARTLEARIPSTQTQPQHKDTTININDITSGSITPNKLDRIYCEQSGTNCPTFLDFQFDIVTVTESIVIDTAGENTLEVNCPTGTKLISCNLNYENIGNKLDVITYSKLIVSPNNSSGCLATWKRANSVETSYTIIAYCLSVTV